MSEGDQNGLEQHVAKWLGAGGPVALRLTQELEPVGSDRIIYPPTYADIGYSIDTLSDGKKVALIDSVGSQANRMEPIFKCESGKPDDWLVPQIQIVLEKTPREVTVPLLDLAHRVGDAVVHLSPELRELVEKALEDLRKGDAGPLCTIAPTSIVFGFWDSRGDTDAKTPRLVRSEIRAWDVEVLHAAAQFNSIWKSLSEEGQAELKRALEEAKIKNKEAKLSEIGLADAPAVFRRAQQIPKYRDGAPNPEARVLGGVLVKGKIKREITINLVTLRGLRGKDDNSTKAIQEYLLGLSLMAATAHTAPDTDKDLFLREGCLLRYAEDRDQWLEVPRRGEPTPIELDPEKIKTFTEHKVKHFRSEWEKVFGKKLTELKYEAHLPKAIELLKKTPEEGKQT